jgi:hypothetical protein
MKKFMPDANGITLGHLAANETVTVEQTWEFKGNYRLPANALPSNIINHDIEHSVEDFDNLMVVAWVQNISTKIVFNSCTAEKGIINPILYPVNFSVMGGNGSINAKVNGEPIISGNEIEAGNTVEFTAAPNNGFLVNEWKHNGAVVFGNHTNTFSVVVSGNETVSVEFKEFTGIEIHNLLAVELYPNPFTNEFIIDNAEYVQKITISNSLGQIVKEEVLTGKQKAAISMQALQSGLYFITLKNNEGEALTKKIVKN